MRNQRRGERSRVPGRGGMKREGAWTGEDVMKKEEKEEWEKREREGGRERWRDREREGGREGGKKEGRASQGPQQRSSHPKVPGSA